MTYDKPTAVDQAIIRLRRGMKWVNISPARRDLEGWLDQSLLLIIPPTHDKNPHMTPKSCLPYFAG